MKPFIIVAVAAVVIALRVTLRVRGRRAKAMSSATPKTQPSAATTLPLRLAPFDVTRVRPVTSSFPTESDTDASSMSSMPGPPAPPIRIAKPPPPRPPPGPATAINV